MIIKRVNPSPITSASAYLLTPITLAPTLADKTILPKLFAYPPS